MFFKQAEFLLRILPLIHKEEVFALKGGTAINFFVRDLPRLSVDIDLTYLPVNERDVALNDIRNALMRISGEIQKRIPGTKVTLRKIHGANALRGMVVEREGVTVKIEPNLVMRGSVYPPEVRTLCRSAEQIFELSLQSRCLSTEELYAGKICAALDRQHPRDLFDVHWLLRNEGVSLRTRKAFLVYVISHPRPIIEILNPGFNDIRDVFEKEFKEMATENLSYEELCATRETLVSTLIKEVTHEEKLFLLSVKEGAPKWNLLGLEGVENLPAVKWKLLNIGKMEGTKHRDAVRKLRDYLNV
ncbi:MAG: nucleotidyl transferase AbiEii/AbiGii toxin family protein [Desulfobacterota bacterium]|nr:nucleotidyl transferase AbiEii/AbiGii toxin family protein [Thermodesulfobacteriota bacterium]